MSKRCEGWTSLGGVFTFGGLPYWVQCENDAVAELTVKQDGEIETWLACKDCWVKCVENKIEIISIATPVKHEFIESKEERVKYGICPNCGSRDLAEVLLVKQRSNIDFWFDGEPEDYDYNDDFIILEANPCKPRYYCNNCEVKFDSPNMVRE